MTCMAAYWLVFNDPQWGPISLQLSVWRHPSDDSPSYEVVVE